ncbi:hypothetical protein [Paenibacillus qinlingensis]|uniref:Uncharacterized protein n=1 Tax=Paenibacillus qinlingensis TaxID=1837343 RepID=A0ABU1P3G3_9BACL|nr:hypothetical protein [Paenibacillus qinlingensis]MDR6554276.1 hypothetical protein [Paenibacillus qinlingensis]
MSLLKRCAFWLIVLSVIVCVCDGAGFGLANLWIRLTPPISLLAKVDALDQVLFDRMNTTKWPGSSALLPVTYFTYVICVVMYGMIGLVVDGFIYKWGKMRAELRGKRSV